MATFSNDTLGNFGVPGFSISNNSTLSSVYDPYSGIDLTDVGVIDDNNIIQISEEITIKYFYWEILLDLFKYAGLTDGGIDMDWTSSTFSSQLDKEFKVERDTCERYFYNNPDKYGLSFQESTDFCKALQSWNSHLWTNEDYYTWGPGGAPNYTQNYPIEMHTTFKDYNGFIIAGSDASEGKQTQGIFSSWEMALKWGGFCPDVWDLTQEGEPGINESFVSSSYWANYNPQNLNEETGELIVEPSYGYSPCQSSDGVPYSVSNPPSIFSSTVEKVTIGDFCKFGVNPDGTLCKNAEEFTILKKPDFNSDYYFNELDKDKRPALGLFATTDNNVSEDNFSDVLSDDKFVQLEKFNLLRNGDGRFVEENEYKTESLGENSFKPQGGWGYIGYDGIGVNLNADNPHSDIMPDTDIENPDSNYASRFVQDPFYQHGGLGEQFVSGETVVSEETFGFGGTVSTPAEPINVFDHIPDRLGFPQQFTTTYDCNANDCSLPLTAVFNWNFMAQGGWESNLSTTTSPMTGIVPWGGERGYNRLSYPHVGYFYTEEEITGWQSEDDDAYMGIFAEGEELTYDLPGTLLYDGRSTFQFSDYEGTDQGGTYTPPFISQELSAGPTADKFCQALGYTRAKFFGHDDAVAAGNMSLMTPRFKQDDGFQNHIAWGTTRGNLFTTPGIMTSDLVMKGGDFEENNPENVSPNYEPSSPPFDNYPGGQASLWFGYMNYNNYGGWDWIDTWTHGDEPHYYITEITCQMVEYDYDSTDGIEYEQYGYGGYFPYPFIDPDVLDEDWQWAAWVKDDDCYSYGRCLKFEADNNWNEIQSVMGASSDDIYRPAGSLDIGSLNSCRFIYRKIWDPINLEYEFALDENLINGDNPFEGSTCENDDEICVGNIEENLIDNTEGFLGWSEDLQMYQLFLPDQLSESLQELTLENVNSEYLLNIYEYGAVEAGSGRCVRIAEHPIPPLPADDMEDSYITAYFDNQIPNDFNCSVFNEEENKYERGGDDLCTGLHRYCMNTGIPWSVIPEEQGGGTNDIGEIGGYYHQCVGHFSPDTTLSGETWKQDSMRIMALANHNQYRTNNQWQRIYIGDDKLDEPGLSEDPKSDILMNPYSSLKVSFWMKTYPEEGSTSATNTEYVEVAITRHPPNHLNAQDDPGGGLNEEYETFIDEFTNNEYIRQYGNHNSIISSNDKTKSRFGSMGRFRNTEVDKWEKFEYIFNLNENHTGGANHESLPNSTLDRGLSIEELYTLYFLVQTSSARDGGHGFRGKVLLDNFKIEESYDFMPDVDVRKRKGPNNYGIGDLTKYYDPTIPDQVEAYNDTAAPLEVQFYFYPRYPYNNFFDKNRSIIHNDFRNGMFYLYEVDWGDGSPKEFTSEPKLLNEEIATYHTYERHGIYEITGTMIRMKPDNEYNPSGIIHHKRFVLRINVNEGLDEDFEYFGATGFSFIPYKNTTPIVGGYSDQSIYYKSIKRQLGMISGEASTDTQFKNEGDRLKTELALMKMDDTVLNKLELLNEFKKERNSKPDNSGITVYNGKQDFSGELGKSIGDTDLTSIRYFDQPKYMSEMLGFEKQMDVITGGPDYSPEYLATLPFPRYFEEFNSSAVFYDGPEYPTVTLSPDSTSQINPGVLGATDIVWEYGQLPLWDDDTQTNNIPLGVSAIFAPSLSAQYVPEAADEFNNNDPWFGSIHTLEDGNTYTFILSPEVTEPIVWSIGAPEGIIPSTTSEITADFNVHCVSVSSCWDENENGVCDDSDTQGLGWNISNVGCNNISDWTTGNRFAWKAKCSNGVEVDMLHFDSNGVKLFESGDEACNSLDVPEGSSPSEDIPTNDANAFSTIGRPDIRDYIERVVHGQDIELSPYIFPSYVYEPIFWPPESAENAGVSNLSFNDYENETHFYPTVDFINENNPGNPSNNRYWKNIIKENTSIFNREDLYTSNGYINIYSEQDWIDVNSDLPGEKKYYYPVLPKYGADGKFISDVYPNNKIPFPEDGPITNDFYSDKSLKISINSTSIETNTFDDKSGNNNYGFLYNDFEPKFDSETLEPKSTKNIGLSKTSKNDGAF